MALDAKRQQELAEGLEQRLGSRTAALLMEHVSALADLTGKVDSLDRKLDALDRRVVELDHKVDLVEQRLTAEIHRTGRTQLTGVVAAMAVFNTGLFAVAAWIRF